MTRHLAGLAAAALAALALAAIPAAASAQEPGDPIVGLDKITTVRQHGGWLLFSRWLGTAYALSTYHDGVVRDLPVPPQVKPFDADAGPDSDGRPSAVVSLCGGPSCDLYVIGFDPGDTLRPVRNANTGGHDETDPSVYEGRLAFVRDYGDNTVVPYTKLLAAPRSRPSSRLSSVPERRCDARGRNCRPLQRQAVSQMELWRRWVAQSWTYEEAGSGGFRQNEIRLTDVKRTDTRQLARMTTGLGGQTYLGPSIARGRVAFFRSCQGDSGGCILSRSASGAIRYRITTQGYEIAKANRDWWSWEFDGVNAFHVPADVTCDEQSFAPATPACAIYRQTALPWEAVDADRLR